VLYGAHLSTSGGIATALDRAAAVGCDAVQVFTQSPRTWRLTNHDPAELARYAPRAAELGIAYSVCHAIYFINLATPDDEMYAKSLATLEATADVAAAIGGDVVFHVGSHRGTGLDATMPRIQNGLARALDRLPDGSWLLLENSAGAGDTIGRDVAELARIIDVAGHDRLGLCIDTCHIFVSGVDIRDVDETDAFLGEIDGTLGLERLRALHVNDSAAPLGSNRDRHAPLLEGEIAAGLGVFLSHPALQGLPAILETGPEDRTPPDAGQVELLKQIHLAGLAARAGV
jgi:deoxyribonuclease-4